MKKIEQFQITSMTVSGFKSYEEPVELVFGNPTVITGGNGRGKTSIADAIAFAVTGLPFFGERGIDKLHNEVNPDVLIRMRFVDGAGVQHELTRCRKNNRMTITYDGYEIRQLDLTDLFGERDVFLSIFNPLYFIEELGESGKNLLERYLPSVSHEEVLARLDETIRDKLKNESILSPEVYLKGKREEIRQFEERINFTVFAIIALVFYILEVIAYWKIFTKAGKPGWHIIIPILNNFDEIDLSWNRTMAWVGLGISLVASVVSAIIQTQSQSGSYSNVLMIIMYVLVAAAIIFGIMMNFKLAKAFGKGIGFFLGLTFLSPIFRLILGFGKAEYQGPQG